MLQQEQSTCDLSLTDFISLRLHITSTTNKTCCSTISGAVQQD